MATATMRWRLRELQARERVTSAELAKRLGAHPGTVARWRSTDKVPGIGQDTIEAIAGALGVTPAELMGLE